MGIARPGRLSSRICGQNGGPMRGTLRPDLSGNAQVKPARNSRSVAPSARAMRHPASSGDRDPPAKFPQRRWTPFDRHSARPQPQRRDGLPNGMDLDDRSGHRTKRVFVGHQEGTVDMDCDGRPALRHHSRKTRAGPRGRCRCLGEELPPRGQHSVRCGSLEGFPGAAHPSTKDGERIDQHFLPGSQLPCQRRDNGLPSLRRRTIVDSADSIVDDVNRVASKINHLAQHDCLSVTRSIEPTPVGRLPWRRSRRSSGVGRRKSFTKTRRSLR